MAYCERQETEPEPIPEPYIENCAIYTQELIDLPDDYPDRPFVITATDTPRDAEIFRIRCEIGNYQARITAAEAELAQLRQELQSLRYRRVNEDNWRVQHLIRMIEIKEDSISFYNDRIDHQNWAEQFRRREIQRTIRDRQYTINRASHLVNQASEGAIRNIERERENQIRENCRTEANQAIEAYDGYNPELWDNLSNCRTLQLEDLEERYAD